MSSPMQSEERGPTGGQWFLALGLTLLGGLSWFIFGWGLVGGLSLIAVLAAVLPAVTCLVAGWLLRSWWGAAAAAGVYVVVSALLWFLAIVGMGDVQAWTVGFPLYVVLPAVVMAAIGTAIGMYGDARRAGQRPGPVA